MQQPRRIIALLLGIGLTTTLLAGSHASAGSKRATTTKRPTASTTPTTTTPARGKIAVGDIGEVVGLDPAVVASQITILGVPQAIYDTLMDVPFGKDPSPELLSSLKESADRKTWTLIVRDGVTFHDGTALTAETVKINLERQRKAPLGASTMALIRSIDVTGSMTLTLTLDKPNGSIPYFLGSTSGIMLSPKAIARRRTA